MARSLGDLLRNAILPLGTTMYVYGGGWDDLDIGAGEECRRIGASPRWKAFFEEQDETYDHREHRLERHNGLDCSAYIGWVLYQTFAKKDLAEGYVTAAKDMAKTFAERGWGTFREHRDVTDCRPGDIMSGCDHVWLSLGECDDGSVLLIHSSPPGVCLCGTPSKNGENRSKAVSLAERVMAFSCPRWHGKYPCCFRGASYLRCYDQMRWRLGKGGVLTDDDGCAIMNAEALIRYLFPERNFEI